MVVFTNLKELFYRRSSWLVWYCSRTGVETYGPGALAGFVKKLLVEHSHVHSCVAAFTAIAELNNCDRDRMACRT